MSNQLSRQPSLVFSYLELRKTIGFLGISLPFVLSIGSWILFQTGIQNAISSYYHTPMRDVFVGTLCVIGFFLFSYRGYDRRDNIAGDLGCLFAVGVALFRTSPDPYHVDIIGHIHEVFAVSFFLTLMYFSLFLFTKTHPRKPPSRRKLQRNNVYKTCGYTMAVCIVLILIHYFLPNNTKALLDPYKPAFWLESISILSFSVSWLIKGEAILKDKV